MLGVSGSSGMHDGPPGPPGPEVIAKLALGLADATPSAHGVNSEVVV